MTIETLSVTPGNGVGVAVKTIDNALHQRVITHRDYGSLDLTLGTTAGAYVAGKVMGGQKKVAGASRANGLEVSITALRITCPLDLRPEFKLLFYPDSLTTTPVDKSDLVLGALEAPKLAGWVQVTAADYVNAGGYSLGFVPLRSPLIVKTSQAEPSFNIVAIADDGWTATGDNIALGLRFGKE